MVRRWGGGGGRDWRDKGKSKKDLGREGEENDCPQDSSLGPASCEWAARRASPLVLPIPAARQRGGPRGEGSWGKGMEDFQGSLAQLPQGALGEGAVTQARLGEGAAYSGKACRQW